MSPLTVLNDRGGVPPRARDRVFDRKGKRPEHYYRDQLFELEEKGELIIHRMGEEQDAVEIETKYGRKKKVPRNMTWHHKSCGQCGHIPGYPTSIFWLTREFGHTYHDPKDQSSCTAWDGCWNLPRAVITTYAGLATRSKSRRIR